MKKSLDYWMRERGFTNVKLAELTGLPPRSIDYYRIGEREPNFAAGIHICKVLEVAPDEIYFKAPLD